MGTSTNRCPASRDILKTTDIDCVADVTGENPDMSRIDLKPYKQGKIR